MAEELSWSDEEKKRQHDMGNEFLQTEMGQKVNRVSRNKVLTITLYFMKLNCIRHLKIV